MKYILVLATFMTGCQPHTSYLKDKIKLDDVKECRFQLRDTLLINRSPEFLKKLGETKDIGICKYAKLGKLILIMKDNTQDILTTDGRLFVWKNFYFQSDSNLIKEGFGIHINAGL